jgi:hypothetical protein
MSIDEVIGILFHPFEQCFNEVIKASQTAFLDTRDPGSIISFDSRFLDGQFKNGYQLSSELISLFQVWGERN